jgi:hypothetical protein
MPTLASATSVAMPDAKTTAKAAEPAAPSPRAQPTVSASMAAELKSNADSVRSVKTLSAWRNVAAAAMMKRIMAVRRVVVLLRARRTTTVLRAAAQQKIAESAPGATTLVA